MHIVTYLSALADFPANFTVYKWRCFKFMKMTNEWIQSFSKEHAGGTNDHNIIYLKRVEVLFKF